MRVDLYCDTSRGTRDAREMYWYSVPPTGGTPDAMVRLHVVIDVPDKLFELEADWHGQATAGVLEQGPAT